MKQTSEADFEMDGLGWNQDVGDEGEEGSGAGRPSDGKAHGNDGADAAEWVGERLGFPADAMQARVLRTASKRGLLNCTRQWGKSTVTAAKAVHQAYDEAGSLTLVVSPSARQSGEFVRKAAGFARRLGIRPKGDGDNEISLVLPNGSRIVGLPGNGGDGAGVLGGVAAAGGRGGAGERRAVHGDPADAGGERRDAVADEHAVREAGVLLRGVGARRARSGSGCG